MQSEIRYQGRPSVAQVVAAAAIHGHVDGPPRLVPGTSPVKRYRSPRSMDLGWTRLGVSRLYLRFLGQNADRQP